MLVESTRSVAEYRADYATADGPAAETDVYCEYIHEDNNESGCGKLIHGHCGVYG